MKAILISMEETNLRFAKARLSNTVSQIRWLWAQTAVFFALGVYFFVIPFFGSSWFYLMTVGIYWGASILFLKWFMPVHRKNLNRCLRQIAGARIRLRKIIEMEEED